MQQSYWLCLTTLTWLTDAFLVVLVYAIATDVSNPQTEDSICAGDAGTDSRSLANVANLLYCF